MFIYFFEVDKNMSEISDRRFIYYGMLAGFLSGVVTGISLLASIGSLETFLKTIIEMSLPPNSYNETLINETLRQIIGVYNVLLYASPLLYGIEMLIFGALFGLFHRWLVFVKGVSEAVGAVLTGVFFMLLVQGIPLGIIYASDITQISVIFSVINPLLVFVPGVTYTLLLLFFAAVDGPWKKWGEGQPEKY